MTGPNAVATVDAMPRRVRNWIPGGTYHVFSRGSNRHALFLYDRDRIETLEYTATVVARYELECLAYALMTNHTHYVFRTPETPAPVLSNALRDLNGTHSRRFNRRHGREAHAFRNRFGAVLQESTEQLLRTARYVVRNPVEAGLCATPAEWPWTSYRATAGLAEAPGWLSTQSLLALFADTVEIAEARYMGFVAETPGIPIGV
jgi:REP element-mobilizing transposase RayT